MKTVLYFTLFVGFFGYFGNAPLEEQSTVRDAYTCANVDCRPKTMNFRGSKRNRETNFKLIRLLRNDHKVQ